MSVPTSIQELHQEIIEIVNTYPGIESYALLATLNGPVRVQKRSNYVRIKDLLDIIIDTHLVDENSMFIVVDEDGGLLASRSWVNPGDAADAAEECDGSVRRFQL